MTEDGKPSWQELREEAALWLARMDSGSADISEFEAWRDADPRRAAAFVQIAGALATIDRNKPELREALPPSKSSTRRRNLLAAAVVAAAAFGIGGFIVSNAKASVKTVVGQRKSINLPDGGVLLLNTDTQVQWRQRGGLIEVWLLKGEISLDLAASTLPCRLYASYNMAQLSKSKVNARLRGKIVDLSVVQGSAALSERHDSGNGKSASIPTLVTVDQSAIASQSQTVVRHLDTSDLDVLSAWPEGELVFQGQSLESAVAEYNRYLKRKIVVVDPSLNQIRLGGRFTTADPAAFLEALKGSFAIKVVDDGTSTIALTR